MYYDKNIYIYNDDPPQLLINFFEEFFNFHHDTDLHPSSCALDKDGSGSGSSDREPCGNRSEPVDMLVMLVIQFCFLLQVGLV